MKTANFLGLTLANPRMGIPLTLRGSVIPTILPRVLICTLFSLVITLLDRRGWNLSISLRDSIVPSIVLGLLLVFRTNTAYERFWEGRKAWGTLINTVRNLSRSIWISVEEPDPADCQQKIIILRLLVAFAIATKLHLRSETINPELADLIPPENYQKLQTINNRPLEIAFWIGNYLQSQYEKNCIHPYQLAAMLKLLDNMVEVLGICERILKTPIPLAYSIHLRQLIFLYCFAAPFQLLDSLGWVTPLVVGVIAFTIFGIEEIGEEIENPFGHDANDLPLDQICRTMRINIEDLISLSPCVQHWQK
ncbi:MAG: bestrophin family ion channel [Snowella sp.]|nr:bestrophin family ion channel [Snowella sp.]